MASPSSAVVKRLSAVRPAQVALPVFGVLSFVGIYKYRKAIRRRIKQVEEESWIFGMGVTMERETDRDVPDSCLVFENLQLLELHPDFSTEYRNKGWSLLSLGEYMSSLRPSQLPKNVTMHDMPKIVHQEVEAGLTAGLLKAVGPNLGRALLPAVGIGPVQGKAQSFAAAMIQKWFSSGNASKDKGGMPVPLMSLLAMSYTNAEINAGNETTPGNDPIDHSAMDKMKLGETDVTPSFVTPIVDGESHLVPTVFVVSRDFEAAIHKMEDMVQSQPSRNAGLTMQDLDAAQDELRHDELLEEDILDMQQKEKEDYDPDSRKMADPLPVNPRLFPGLHLGWGDSKCTHTNREVLKNRLLSIVLNKLGANYNSVIKGEGDIFWVQMSENDKPLTKPSEFVQALIDSGHDIEVFTTCHVTTFGISLSVKEKDGSWSNIPLSCFVESGYEDSQGTMAPAFLPHSGLDMDITGPLIGNQADGTPNKCSIQHYIAIDGFCGWHSNHNARVPWLNGVECGNRVKGKDAVRAARLAGLYANVLNGLATDTNLPYGGYGLTAVCNDSAAVIEQCLHGTFSIYPMTSIGRFLQRTMRYAQGLRNELSSQHGMEDEVQDMNALIKAMREIPSDINASPSNARNAAKRMLHCLPPEMPFALMEDTKRVMESILHDDEAEAALVERKEKKE